jgi:hypothetical protein
MRGISYITDEKNKKVAAVVDLKKYGQYWEDFYDFLQAEMRKNEKKTSLSDFKKELKREGRI